MATISWGALYIVSWFPRWLCYPVYYFAVVLTQVFARKEMSWFWQNVELIYGLPRHSVFARQFRSQWMHHTFFAQIETVRAVVRSGSVVIEGLDDYRTFVRSYKDLGRGLIVCSGHLGSWELLAKNTSFAFGEPIKVLAKPSSRKWLNKLLARLRLRMESEVLWSNSKSLLRDMLSCIKKGGALGFVMDQKPLGRRGIEIPFLGHDTEFVSGPAQIAIKTNCPIIAAFCVRLSPYRFKMVFFEIAAEPSEQSEEELTRKIVDKLQHLIRCYPEQWTWNYRRWKL